MVAISFLFVHYGSGRHQSTTPLANVIPQLKLALAQRLVYQLVVGTTKISLCFFYLRIFTDKKGQWVSYGVMAFVSVYTIGLFLTSLLGCIPTQDIWSLKPKGRCSGSHGRLIVIYTSGALNILTDFVLLVFVIPRIRKFSAQNSRIKPKCSLPSCQVTNGQETEDSSTLGDINEYHSDHCGSTQDGSFRKYPTQQRL